MRNSILQRIFAILKNVLKGSNIAFFKGVRLDGKFVSKNVKNLSRRDLSASEISLLS